MTRETTCLYCGQRICVVEEQGRPKALQNGKPHKCKFTALGFSASAIERNLSERKQTESTGRRRFRDFFWRLFG